MASATSGSVNEGCTIAARRGRSAREQGEALRGPGQDQHLVRVPAVASGDRLAGVRVLRGRRVAADVADGRHQSRPQPGRRGGQPHVHRVVDQAWLGVDVTVVAERAGSMMVIRRECRCALDA